MTNNMITTTEGSAIAAEQNTSNPNYAFDTATFSPAQLEESLVAFKDFLAKMPPLITLTDKQRRRVPRVGIRTRGFLELFIEAAQVDRTILPSGITLEKFMEQVDLFNGLSLIQTRVADCNTALADSTLAVGAELYATARSGYAMLKTPAGAAKVQEQRALMKQRFVTKAKRNQTPPEETELAA
jgi:hypothetical protein